MCEVRSSHPLELSMKQIEAVIVWTPVRWAGLRPETAGQIAVVPTRDEAGVSSQVIQSHRNSC